MAVPGGTDGGIQNGALPCLFFTQQGIQGRKQRSFLRNRIALDPGTGQRAEMAMNTTMSARMTSSCCFSFMFLIT